MGSHGDTTLLGMDRANQTSGAASAPPELRYETDSGVVTYLQGR